MVNVNLSTSGNQQKNGVPYAAGITIVIIILVLVGLVWGGIVFYKNYLVRNVVNTKALYEVENRKLTGEGGLSVMDFQNRLTIAKNLLNQKKIARETLGKVESSIIPEVYLNSYNYDGAKNVLSLDCVGDNFNSAAKQILSFKKSDYVSDVTVGKTSLNDKGKVSFLLDLKIK